MLLLVSGANYFVMFVGWEGNFHCLKWFNIDSIFYNVIYLNTLNKITSTRPHNIEILSIIIGSTLGLKNKNYSTSNLDKPYRLTKLEQENLNISKELKEILMIFI